MHGNPTIYPEILESKRSLYIGMADSYFPYISNDVAVVDTNDIINNNNTSQYQNTEPSKTSDGGSSEDNSAVELTEADVYTQLEKKERDLVLAAELGKALLEQNEELRGESERLDDHYRQQIEDLEQEKYALQQQLQRKQSEVEAVSHEMNVDVVSLQEELGQRKTQAKLQERENSRIIEELSDQNQKLLDQLNRASKAEEQLTSQVQQLRKDFNDRASKSTLRITQLESMKEELLLDCQIQQGVSSNTILEQRYRAMCEDRDQAVNALSDANERMKVLERQLHDRERELKRVTVELTDSHSTNRQLQVRIDELREEMVLQMSFNSGTNESLLSEMEQSGFSQDGLMELSKSVSSLSSKENPDDTSGGDGVVSDVIIPPDVVMTTADEQCTVSGKVFSCLAHSINNCLSHIFELKQEVWDSYIKVRNLCNVIRPVVEVSFTETNEESSTKDTLASGSLMSIISDLDSLIEKAVEKSKKSKDASVEPQTTITEFDNIIKERDEASKAKKVLEVELARTKADLMVANTQLIEAIQQKVDQQRELEAWHDDMELMIQKALVERNEATKALSNALKKSAELDKSSKETPTKNNSSWLSTFSFGRTRQSSGDSNDSPSPSMKLRRQASASPSVQRTPSRLSTWLRRRQNNEEVDGDTSTTSETNQT